MREDDGFCFYLLPKDMVINISLHLTIWPSWTDYLCTASLPRTKRGGMVHAYVHNFRNPSRSVLSALSRLVKMFRRGLSSVFRQAIRCNHEDFIHMRFLCPPSSSSSSVCSFSSGGRRRGGSRTRKPAVAAKSRLSGDAWVPGGDNLALVLIPVNRKLKIKSNPKIKIKIKQ